MTATESDTLDLGKIAVLLEAHTPDSGPMQVDVASIDEMNPTPGAAGWTFPLADATVVVAPIDSPGPQFVAEVLEQLGAQLGAVADEVDASRLPGPVASSAVAVRLGDGNGLAVYLVPSNASANDVVGVPSPAADDIDDAGLITFGMLREVPLEVSAELGRTKMSVSEILQLTVGSVVELDRTAGAPVDVVVNGSLIARGEVVVIDDEYGVRITEILGRVTDSL